MTLTSTTPPTPRTTPLTTWLTAVALTAAALTTACKVGYEPLGGEGETGDGDGDPTAGDGDGDPTTGDGDGDGDGDSTTGDGDGDGDPTTGDGDGDPGDCPPAPLHPGPVSFAFTVSVANNALEQFPIAEPCTITALSQDPASLTLDCPSADVALTVTAEPALTLFGEVGDTVDLWLYHDGDEYAPTWMRLGFPDDNGDLFIIDAGDLQPPEATGAYFPAPWGLAVADTCGPVDEGCGILEHERLTLDFLGTELSAWPEDYASADLSQAAIELWNARSDEIVGTDPLCDPTPDFFLSHRLMIRSTGPGASVGEVCDPGDANACATGLHCCYPCGVPDCDHVCTPEDPQTMECPLPPP